MYPLFTYYFIVGFDLFVVGTKLSIYLGIFSKFPTRILIYKHQFFVFYIAVPSVSRRVLTHSRCLGITCRIKDWMNVMNQIIQSDRKYKKCFAGSGLLLFHFGLQWGLLMCEACVLSNHHPH